MLDTPDEAGLGAFVRLDKGPFIGRDAVVPPARCRPRRPEHDGCGPSSIGGARATCPSTAARRSASVATSSGACAARLRPTVSRTIGYAYCPARPGRGRRFWRWMSSASACRRSSRPTSCVDPAGERMRCAERAALRWPLGADGRASQPSRSGPSSARGGPGPALLRPAPEVVVDRSRPRLDGGPERPADVGHDHLQPHPGEQRVGGPPEVGGAQLADPGVIPAQFLARVAELEGRVVVAAVLVVDDPEPLAVIEVVLGEQVVVAGDGRQAGGRPGPPRSRGIGRRCSRYPVGIRMSRSSTTRR